MGKIYQTNNKVVITTKLSICIATYNREKYISETIDSIISQLVPGVELVIVDGCSTDNTAEVMVEFISQYPEIRYIREQENSGVDRDFDKAVEYANGEYCWLMTDDDLMCPGAVKRVLSTISNPIDLAVVDAEVRNADMTLKIRESRLKFSTDRIYKEEDQESFFVDVADHLSFIGCVIIRRDFWLSRDRSSYYGTVFIHVGVIFQHPPPKFVHVISDQLIIIRYGNAMWTPRAFNIWMFKWPQLIWSFPDYSDKAKQSICDPEPWRRIKQIFLFRAKGAYSVTEFKKYFSGEKNDLLKFILFTAAIFPEKLANLAYIIYYLVRCRADLMGMYDLTLNRNAPILSRLIARMFGV